MTIAIEPVSENTLLIQFPDSIDLSLPKKLKYLTQQIKQNHEDVILEITPSYRNILIMYRLSVITEKELINALHQLIDNTSLDEKYTPHKVIELPAFYHTKVGPDLEWIAKQKNLSIEQVIHFHSSMTYTVCAIGFMPGFGFLSQVNKRIAVPRRETPRSFVISGSIGIANQQTAVYPNASPGGWNIIGNCPISLYQPNELKSIPFEIGDQVKFYPITETKFIELGGKSWPH